MVHSADIGEFVAMSRALPVFDVRSPGEYAHAHIPGSRSLPLFTDEERKVVGTAYKQQSREDAIKIGLDYYGVKMRGMVEQVEQLMAGSQHRTILVHCWRGGMRSAAVAWLLDLYGFKVHTLQGGYKAFRNWALAQFNRPYPITILGGYTGAGKTDVLHELAAQGQPVIDLEGLAGHKGSAFGGIGLVQPTQEMFENELAVQLDSVSCSLKMGEQIWVENESQRIGDIILPNSFYQTMMNAELHFLDVPLEARLDNIVKDYGKHKKEELINAIVRIQKRLGGLNTKLAVNALIEGDLRASFAILLAYYDKFYDNGLKQKAEQHIAVHHTAAKSTDAKANCNLLLAAQQQTS